jgi:Carboxypeptidase regulatory-like domain
MLTTLFCAAAMLFASEVDQQPAASSAQVVGRVVDADSKAPIAGARVMLAPVRTPRSPVAPMTPVSTLTDNRGRFAFADIEAGRFRVTVLRAGYVFDPINAPTVDLHPGQPSSLDIALSRGAVLTGRILDQQGEPLPDVRVSALRRMPDRGDRFVMAAPAHATTNDLGEFRVSGLLPGEYVLMADAQPIGPFTRTLLAPSSPAVTWAPTYYPGTTNQADAQIVVLQQADTVTDLEFRMVSAPAYRVSGIAVDASGKPVAEVMILLRPTGDISQRGFTPPLSASSKVDGTFTISGVIAGNYAIYARRIVHFSSGGGSSISMVGGRSGGIAGVSPLEQQITVDGADVSGINVIVPSPGQ